MKKMKIWHWVVTTTAAVGVIAGVTAVTTSAAVANGSTAAKPTIVLVHGAWADGSSWSGEVSLLQHKGYTVDVAPNPLRGVASDSDYLKSYLSTIKGPIVLVGHSYGGFVTTNAATGNPNVKALVYVDAFIPDQGESVASLAKGSGSVVEPALTDPTKVFNLVPFPGAPSGVGDSYVLPSVFVPGFTGDMPLGQAETLAASQMPLATSAFGEQSGVPAWKTIPSWAVVGTKDMVIPEKGQMAMAGRANAQVTTVDGPHLTLILHPQQVTDVIVKAATAIS
jgi:pimeloyl-ACP methyl ester carboxylesterase